MVRSCRSLIGPLPLTFLRSGWGGLTICGFDVSVTEPYTIRFKLFPPDVTMVTSNAHNYRFSCKNRRLRAEVVACAIIDIGPDSLDQHGISNGAAATIACLSLCFPRRCGRMERSRLRPAVAVSVRCSHRMGRGLTSNRMRRTIQPTTGIKAATDHDLP